MTNAFSRAKLIIFGLFLLSVAGFWGYNYFYVWPGQRCEAAGRWWAMKERVCGVPVKISTITGRPDPVPAPTPAPKAAPQAAPQSAPKAP